MINFNWQIQNNGWVYFADLKKSFVIRICLFFTFHKNPSSSLAYYSILNLLRDTNTITQYSNTYNTTLQIIHNIWESYTINNRYLIQNVLLVVKCVH